MAANDVLKSKSTSIGYVEIRESGVLGWYALYVDGQLKEQSASLSTIEASYNRIS